MAPRFTWDGSQQDFRLCKLGFLASINDVTHHSKFTATTKLQNNMRRHWGNSLRKSLFTYLNCLLK